MTGYLDCAATAPPLGEAVAAALLAGEELFFNPSAQYAPGLAMAERIAEARSTLARAVGAGQGRIVFTSGGTESINTALFGGTRKNARRGRHLVSTAIEHPASLAVLKELAAQGWQLTLVGPEPDGTISAEKLLAAVREDTALISLMAVNNETGALLPWEEVAREARDRHPDVLIHLDAVQALMKLPLKLDPLVDLASMSAHKVGGLKGCGALFIGDGLKLPPLIYGGGQEEGLRGGTEGVPQILAFDAALKTRQDKIKENWARVSALGQYLLGRLDELGINYSLNSPEGGSPYIVNLSPDRGRSEVFIRFLSDRGVFVSGGSACARGRRSHVLEAMRLPPKRIDSALRLSFCPETTEEDIDLFCEGLKDALRLFK